MAARRHKGHEEHEEHFDESWLVSYADMMTLLVALFMVLFSISSVNISKFEDLQRSLSNAFSGKVLPGGKGIQESGGSDPSVSSVVKAPDTSALVAQDGTAKQQAAAAKAEGENLEALRKAIAGAVRDRGLSSRVRTRVTRRGLEVRLLTDDLLFASGSAVVQERGAALLRDVGEILGMESQHPVVVEGHTDDVPIATAQFPTNWELSSARATGVVRALTAAGIPAKRLTAQGRADLDGIASNRTASGRALNRRVEILLPRQVAPPTGAGATTSGDPAVTAAVDAAFPSISPEIQP